MMPVPGGKIFKNNTSPLNFFEQNCVLPWKFERNLSENSEMLLSKRFKSHLQSASGLKDDALESMMKNIDGADYAKDTLSCNLVPRANLVLCSAVRPHTEKYMIVPPEVYHDLKEQFN